jgi:CRISPR system Cascade subunit CasE
MTMPEVIVQTHSRPGIPVSDTLHLRVHRILYPELLDARGAKEVVYRGFLKYPDKREDEPRWFLYRWRTAVNDHTARTSILVVATKVPDWSSIPMANVTETEVNIDLIKGSKFRFELRCAPTAKGPMSKKQFIKNGDSQIAWLAEHGEKHGFYLDGCSGHQDRMWCRRTPEQVKKGKADGYTQPFVDFAGALTITDPALFRERFFVGIGPGKHLGLGLLVLHE